MLVCRGGDCGSGSKHPGLDHRGQLRDLKAQLAGEALVIATKCLDACDHSNVVVVLPGSAKLAALEPIWVGQVNDMQTTTELVTWIAEANLEPARQPISVELNRFSPTRANRRELAEEIANAVPRKKR